MLNIFVVLILGHGLIVKILNKKVMQFFGAAIVNQIFHKTFIFYWGIFVWESPDNLALEFERPNYGP